MSVAGLGESCACGHAEGLHRDVNATGIGGGSCRVELPPFLEEELPAWRCPCPRFRAAPRGPWRWHEPTQSWALVLEVEDAGEGLDCSPLNSPAALRGGARVTGGASTGVNLPDTRAS